ncbi:BTB/POZ domain-containing protein 6-like [Mercenaria mercenaria]|uniref:BTB/POZ domain-containing protein 6-like n=1 Tax=Mercenaria mercenaria TaxID=6596 RepID=UPI00234F2042|nr:BTB/POZ domain-containing protein 6-like [Mercenaria mercenaria]XP_053373263.1 BTB/POZ domain-containing protein 6-like [Mercenaria mercenaria]XP_053373265.1 BTB/POZ domain-containing protein 6-like [Mercenaria mercenaria]
MASPTAWQTERSFEQTNWHMLQDGTLCDVTFFVGNEKKEEVKAHKFILASRSPVFYAMFCGSLAESSKILQVPDIEHEIFRVLLQFIYTEDCTVNEDNVMPILYSAKKYETSRLTEKCKDYLNTQLSTDNVCVILQHAHKFDEAELEQKCLQFIFDKGDDVLKSDGFSSLPKEVLQKIIESDSLNADELSIYDACKRWAVEQQKPKSRKPVYSETELRQELGELVYFIRFPTMSLETFAKRVAVEDILTPEEKVSVFQSLAGVYTKTLLHRFRNTKRKRVLKLSRFDSSYPSGWTYAGAPDAINFKVSCKCTLLGVSLFAPCVTGTVEGEVSLKNGTSTLASRSDVRIEYEQSKHVEDVLFDQSYTVEPGKEYTIHTLLKGTETYRGDNGKQRISSGTFDLSFFSSDASKNGTSVDRGQIHSFILEVFTTA